MNANTGQNTDQQTYQRALLACLLGLGAQLALTVGSALVQLWSGSPAVAAITWHLLGGVPIWVILLLIYQQHRLERAEALEAEQLARGSDAGSSIFETAAEDLGLARRRLDNLYKWGIHLVSVLVALYLLIVGTLLLQRGWSLLQDAAASAAARAVDLRGDVGPALTAVNLRAIAVGTFSTTIVNGLVIFAAAAGIVAFVTARYISGMTRLRAWAMLRGGAGYLMGNVLMLVLLLAAAFTAFFADLTFVGLMALIVPGFMMLVGLEILLLMLLGAYRPRRPGELPRPAFESRLLGWLTRPESIAKIINETINYQFGFEVSRSWFYQLLGRAVTPLLLFSAAVMLAASCLVIVAPHEQVIITRFGRITHTQALGPGAHLKLPWPLSKTHRYPVDRVEQIVVGSVDRSHAPDLAVLWTNIHAQHEGYLITGTRDTAAAIEHADTGGKTAAEAGTPADNPANIPDDAAIDAPQSGDDRNDESDATAAAALASRAPGVSLVAAEIVVRYRIHDLHAYVSHIHEPRRLLRALSERRVNELFVTSDIEQLLGDKRLALSDTLRERLQADADALALGVSIQMAAIVGVHPPQPQGVAEAFQEQIGALQQKEAAIEDARRQATGALAAVAGSVAQAEQLAAAIRELERTDAQTSEQRMAMLARIDRMLTAARGEAARVVHEALAYRWQREMLERGKAHRFLAQAQAFGRAPRYYMHQEYLDALTEVLPHTRRFIVPGDAAGGGEGIIRLDLTEAASALGTLLDGER